MDAKADWWECGAPAPESPEQSGTVLPPESSVAADTPTAPSAPTSEIDAPLDVEAIDVASETPPEHTPTAPLTPDPCAPAPGPAPTAAPRRRFVFDAPPPAAPRPRFTFDTSAARSDAGNHRFAFDSAADLPRDPVPPQSERQAWISRPARPAERSAPQPTPPEPPAATYAAPQVLLAEPDLTTARVLEHRLTREGIAVTTVDDAESALRHLELGGLDLLLLDADLPGGALEMLRRFRVGGGTVPTIVLGWPGNDLVAVRAFGLGSDDVIVRPFSLVEAVARIRYQLARAGVTLSPR